MSSDQDKPDEKPDVSEVLGVAAFDADADTSSGDEEKQTEEKSADVSAGTQIGRYLTLGKLGEGGMGMVFSAYDPQLDRKVALKLLHPNLGTADSVHGKRLLQEAKAIAKLAHPNVVTVHDAGQWENRVFVAMEFVEGCGLDEWLKEEKRDWKEVLAQFREAGKGLAAAHAVGLVHRDFKPSNVLLGKDGRVRVIDFGLAKETMPENQTPSPKIGAPRVLEEVSDQELIADLKSRVTEEMRNEVTTDRLTMAGQLLGTPAYMSPEQHGQGEPDARSDQYNFCASLYHALYGELPFRGNSMAQVLKKKQSGKVLSPSSHSSVPGWLRQVVLKGLSPRPENRWASMHQLLLELAYDPAKKRRRLLWGSGALLALALGLGAWMYARSYREGLCELGSEEMGKVWNPASRTAIEQAFLGTKLAYANDMWVRTASQLETYVKDWVGGYREACRATQVDGKQTEHMMELRLACLRRRLQELSAFVELFSKADAKLVERSLEAISQMETLRQCADLDALLKQWTIVQKPPKNPQAVEAIRQDIAKLMALESTIQCDTGKPLAESVAKKALQEQYPPVEAEAGYWSGRMAWQCGEFPQSESDYRRAFLLALQNGDELLSLKSVVELARVTGVELAHQEDWKVWSDISETLMDRLQRQEPERSRLTTTLGLILQQSGKIDQALERFKTALSMREKAYGREHMLVIYSLHMIGNVYLEKEQPLDAAGYLEQAMSLLEKVMGKTHPFVADILLSMGNAQMMQGEHQKAQELFEKALRISENNYGRKNYYTALCLHYLAWALSLQGRHGQAITTFQEVLAIMTELFTANSSQVANTFIEIGAAYARKGDTQRSEQAYQKALEMLRTVAGGQGPLVAEASLELGEIYVRQGQLSKANPLIAYALDSYRKTSGTENSSTVWAEIMQGALYLGERQPVKAIPLLEKAMAFLIKQQVTARTRLSWAQFLLAQSLQQTQGNHQAQVVELAEKAYANCIGAKDQDLQLKSKLERFSKVNAVALDAQKR